MNLSSIGMNMTNLTKLAPTWWNDPRMCTHNKDNEGYIYLRNKDTMSQSLPQPGGMTQECALIRIMNGTSTYVTRTPCHKACPQPGGMTQECALIIRIMNGTSTYVTRTPCHKACPNLVE